MQNTDKIKASRVAELLAKEAKEADDKVSVVKTFKQ